MNWKYLAYTAALLLLVSACSTAPPDGEPIDFEQTQTFKSFRLQDLDGEMRTLEDFLADATIVNFFFPT